MKYRNLITGVAAAMFCTALLGTSSDAIAAESYWETQETDADLKGSEFILVGESDSKQLLVNPKSATIRWMDTETGVYQDTNLTHDENLAKITDAEKSDVAVTYYSGTNSNLYATYSNYGSYTMGVAQNQVGYQKMDNGVRVIYALGEENAITYKNFPPLISDERLQELVLSKMDNVAIDRFKTGYYVQMSDGTWSRRSNKDAPLVGLAAQDLYNIFYEQGDYTHEELIADLEAMGADADQYPSNLLIRFAVEYYLDGEELVVNLDAGKLETHEDNPVRDITLLPYFLTSSTDAEAEEDGYMFIPDGSGALINLDSTRVSELRYEADFYGGDPLVDASRYSSTDPQLMMPVIGMKNNDTTILGVIENGAEVASLQAYISGTDNSEPFSKLKLTFDIRTQQQIVTEGSNSYTIYKATDDIYDDMITLRYFWLDEDATYVDMANCYREYLEKTGDLKAEAVEEEAPFYVELLGVTDKTEYMLGIPYEGTQVMTSFSEAQEILTDMNGAGINNIKLIYSGMLNGGMNQRALTDGVGFAPDLGGSSAFKKLVSYAESIGAEIYPNMLTQSAYTKKDLSGDKMAYNIVNERGEIFTFDLVQEKVADDIDYKQYIVSPNFVTSYLDKAKSSYTKKIGLKTLASEDLFTYFGTNYRDVHVSPSSAEEVYKNVLANMADGMTLMLSNPISEAYPYSNYLTDIPTEDSGIRILDASVPFAQIVLDGYKTYSAESLNKESTDVWVNFMRAIESKSAPKFTFMYRDSALLEGTTQEDLFAINYSYWKDQVADYYSKYQEFYSTVKGEMIVDHELYQRNDKLRVVTYSNGVKIYFNYSDLDEKIDGVSVPAFSYEIVK